LYLGGFSCDADPALWARLKLEALRLVERILHTGLSTDEGLFRVWDGIGITNMIDVPDRWDLVAAKRVTETHLPMRLILRHVCTIGLIQSKADRTGSPEGRDG
jgi:hypothetical protein